MAMNIQTVYCYLRQIQEAMLVKMKEIKDLLMGEFSLCPYFYL